MYTVIILSKHSSDLLKDYRFLFRPFLEKGAISFCDWNESGTDVNASVPDLYRTIKGHQRWRAIIVDLEPAYGKKNGPVPDKKNPFDYPKEAPDPLLPQPSPVPVIRLSHMLCGYPVPSVKNFEDGYEYTDEVTGQRQRVRASELSEEEYYDLVTRHKSDLRQVYMAEKLEERTIQARKVLEEKYDFLDVRPQEVYLVSTRSHLDDEEHIYASWKTPLEMESSDFSRRNHYPSTCRFLCSDLSNPENSFYKKELLELWLAILTLSINAIPASILQAYKLYCLGAKISEEELSLALNEHLNKMEAAYAFIQERFRMKPEYSFEEKADIVEKQSVPVIFEEVSNTDLLIDTRHIGLSRGCPNDEMEYWRIQAADKRDQMKKLLKAPRRAIDKASQFLKGRAESFFDDEYELDKFQLADLKEEVNALELRVLTCDTHSMIDEKRFVKELNKADREVKKALDARIRKSTAVRCGVLFLLMYLIGYLPYMFHSLQAGASAFAASVLLSAAAVLFVSLGGIAALFLMRREIIALMERFNSLMKEFTRNVNSSAKKFEEYFSVLCTFMKAQSIYTGASRKSDYVSARIAKLRMHKQALTVSIERDEEIAAVYGIRREADFESNAARFFDEDKQPQENGLYYYEAENGQTDIPLNKTGDYVKAPYKFVAELEIERLEIYEDEKEEVG